MELRIMFLLKLIYVFTFSVIFLSAIAGCKDRFQEGYEAGYSDGLSDGTDSAENKCTEKVEEEKKACRDQSYLTDTSSEVTTEVCGDAGVNANGKHYSGGKTGCVRVYSDGRVDRY